MVQNLCSGVLQREIYHCKAELIGFNMMYKILTLDEDKWPKFEFIHYYPGKFSLFLIFLLDHLGLLLLLGPDIR